MAKIIGNTVGIPNPKPDWNQTDESKADYIKNKPNLRDYSNVLKGIVNGRDAIKLDNVSPIEHRVIFNISRVNLLSSPFGEINVEEGKNYTLSFKLKEDVVLPEDAQYHLAWYSAEGNWSNKPLIAAGSEVRADSTTFNAYASGVVNYHIYQENMTEDMFEYVQLEEGMVATTPTPYIEDMNSVSFFALGKNLYNYGGNTGGSQAFNLGAISMPSVISFTVDSSKNYATLQLQRKEGDKYEKVVYIASSGVVRTPYFVVDGQTNLFGEYRVTTSSNTEAGALTGIQIEIGETATEYESYKEPVKILDINNIDAIHPSMTIISDTSGVNMNAQYNKDLNGVIADLTSAIISLGGNV